MDDAGHSSKENTGMTREGRIQPQEEKNGDQSKKGTNKEGRRKRMRGTGGVPAVQ